MSLSTVERCPPCQLTTAWANVGKKNYWPVFISFLLYACKKSTTPCKKSNTFLTAKVPLRQKSTIYSDNSAVKIPMHILAIIIIIIIIIIMTIIIKIITIKKVNLLTEINVNLLILNYSGMRSFLHKYKTWHIMVIYLSFYQKLVFCQYEGTCGLLWRNAFILSNATSITVFLKRVQMLFDVETLGMKF